MRVERLRLHEICKNFGAHRVLENLTFKVHAGEVLALLGDNGAGKSTLIKLISGYHSPSSGGMFWESTQIEPTQYDPSMARSLGVQTVYQNLGLVEQLSIVRNFFLGCEPTQKFGPFKWLKHSHMREIVRVELKKMGLTRDLDPDDCVINLSGGERQSIAIGRACFFGAKLLILDEPTSALSLRQTEEVLSSILRAKEAGVAVIFITHSLQHIEGIVDRILILNQGKCVGQFEANSISPAECAQLIIQGKMASPRGFEPRLSP